MGLLFNTAETMKMVARVNKHFSAASEGGKIVKWRNKRRLFKKGGPDRKFLRQIANDEGVRVDPSDDDDNDTRNQRWLDWLHELRRTPSTTLGEFFPNTTPPSATVSDVGTELSHAIWQGLSDYSASTNVGCQEIVFSIIPSSGSISIDEPQKIPTAGGYTLLLTIRTVEAKNMKATIKKMVQARRAGRKKKS